MGMGDVKLALLLGAALGRTVAGGADGGHARGARPQRSSSSPATAAAARKMAIPFGPFLALGGLVALFSGDQLLDAYLTLLETRASLDRGIPGGRQAGEGNA